MKRDAPQLLDASVPLLVGAFVTVGVVLHAHTDTRPLALSLALGAAAALTLRRRAPVSTLVVCAGLALAVFAVDHAAGAIAVVAPAVALYTLALTRSRAQLIAAIVASVAAVVFVDTVLAGRHPTAFTLRTVSYVALIAVPVLAAEALRNRRAYVQLLLEQLELAKRGREEEARRRAEQERLRIARDLHDVVAHTLTTITVQAAVAAHLLGSEDSDAAKALASIETAGRDAIDELHAILGVLRDGSEDEPSLSPAPGLAAIDGLIEQARSSGLEVSLDVEGKQPTRISDAVQLAAYRILQESLTNARRHAPGAAAHVRLAYCDDRLRLAIENDATATATAADGSRLPGVGILGMRERASALGGTVETGCADGCFRILAELPYRRGA